MKMYSYRVCENLIERYLAKGGEAVQLDEGTLGCGNWVLFDYDSTNNLRCFVIKERYINEWSSGQTITSFKNWAKLPNKWKKAIENY